VFMILTSTTNRAVTAPRVADTILINTAQQSSLRSA